MSNVLWIPQWRNATKTALTEFLQIKCQLDKAPQREKNTHGENKGVLYGMVWKEPSR